MPISWGEKANNIERIGKSQHFLSKFLQRSRYRRDNWFGHGVVTYVVTPCPNQLWTEMKEMLIKIRIGNSTPIRR